MRYMLKHVGGKHDVSRMIGHWNVYSVILLNHMDACVPIMTIGEIDGDDIVSGVMQLGGLLPRSCPNFKHPISSR